MRFDIPVDPSSPDAQDWIRQELAKPEYQTAKPTWFDVTAKQFGDWWDSLFEGPGGDADPGSALLILVVLLTAGVIVAAFLIFGRPRLNRRSAAARTLFGSDETRDAAKLRASAATAAQAGDWVTAIEEQFRAIAAGLDERTLVRVSPGTTATEFAKQAAAIAPAEAEALRHAARFFDEVRYLDRAGAESQYQLLVALDQRLRQPSPAQQPPVPQPPPSPQQVAAP